MRSGYRRPYLKMFKSFGRSVVKDLVIQGEKQLLWRFGAGVADKTYKVLDVLASSNGDYNTQLWTFLSGQFHKYIINKITVYINDCNIANTYQQDMNSPLDYTNTTVSLNTNFPFANGKMFAYSRTAGEEGYYLEIFRSTAEADNLLEIANKNILRVYKLLPKGSDLRTGRRGLKLAFYPKCKKFVDLTVENLPFGTVTVGNCLAKMQPKHFDFFRLGIGFQPYVTNLDKDIKSEAYELEAVFYLKVVIKMTLLYGNVVDFTN